MRKFIAYLVFYALIILMVGTSTLVGSAQTDVEPTPTTTEDTSGILADPDVFTLAELGYTESFMVGPYDVIDIIFSIPDSWKLQPGTYLQLKLSYTLGGTGVSRLDESSWVGGTVLVRYNNVQVDTVLLDNTDPQTINLVFPVDSLEPEAEDGRHHLRFFLDASMHCDNYEDMQSVVMIESDSFIKFVYDIKEPDNDLTKFPSPFYLPDSIVPGEVLIVLPDDPNAMELEAGLAVAAGLGSITNGQSKVETFRNSDLTQDMLNNNHLIFVGKSENFGQFQNLDLPVPLLNSRFDLEGSLNENGVIESIISPWNPLKLIMLVGGNTDEAVAKAAKAVSSGKIVVSGISNLSLVDQINPTEIIQQPVVDQTLASLGFETSSIGVYGDVYYDITFYATAEQAKSEGAYFEIISTRSNLLDFNRSGVMLLLNDEVVGTLGFSAEDSSVITEKIEFLPNFIRRGENRLEIISSLIPYDACFSNELETSWVTLSEQSTIHLPVSDQQTEIGERMDLDNYPQMLLGNRQLDDLVFVVPRNSISVIQSAANLAYYLGNKEKISLANFKVYYADELAQEEVVDNNVIFLGTATTLPQITELNGYLPASFPDGSDQVNQPKMPVNFSVLEDTSVGYIELLESPWNSEKSILLVMGNSQPGISFAQNALTNDLLVNELVGDFAAVFGDQIMSVNTKIQSSSIEPMPTPTQVPNASGEDSTPESTQTDLSPVARPPWLVPTILGVSFLMVVAIVVVVLRGTFSGKNR